MALRRLIMSVSGYLVPFPDPGAADLMSDHLEQEVQTFGPGQVLMRVSLPRNLFERPEARSKAGSSFARKRLELFKREGDGWVLLWGATTDSDQAREEVSWNVATAGTLKCRLTNMTGVEGQFSLECTFVPSGNH
jgi:hypothetical protein